MQAKVILIQADASAKPVVGAPCNGCGVCCLAEPCPLGVLLSGRFTGSCDALVWQAPEGGEPSLAASVGAYRCGAVTNPEHAVRTRLPRGMQWCVPMLSWGLATFARRWISAGSGCDCNLSVSSSVHNSVSEPAGDKLPP